MLLMSLSLLFLKLFQPYSSNDKATAWKNACFILRERSDFHLVNNLFIAVHFFPMHMLTSLFVDEILLLRYMNWSTNSRGLPFNVLSVHVEANASCCLLLAMLQRFCLGRCTCLPKNWQCETYIVSFYPVLLFYFILEIYCYSSVFMLNTVKILWIKNAFSV